MLANIVDRNRVGDICVYIRYHVGKEIVLYVSRYNFVFIAVIQVKNGEFDAIFYESIHFVLRNRITEFYYAVKIFIHVSVAGDSIMLIEFFKFFRNTGL